MILGFRVSVRWSNPWFKTCSNKKKHWLLKLTRSRLKIAVDLTHKLLVWLKEHIFLFQLPVCPPYFNECNTRKMLYSVVKQFCLNTRTQNLFHNWLNTHTHTIIFQCGYHKLRLLPLNNLRIDSVVYFFTMLIFSCVVLLN